MENNPRKRPTVKRINELEHENETLKYILREILWMARRYADGRKTYATLMCNEALNTARRLGVKINPDCTTQDPDYAVDGMFGHWLNGQFVKNPLAIEKDFHKMSFQEQDEYRAMITGWRTANSI